MNIHPVPFRCVCHAAVWLLLAHGTAAVAGIADAPLFLTGAAQPYIMLGVDDSSSMKAEVVMPGGGDSYYSSSDSGSRKYLFPDGNDTSSTIPPLPEYANARCPCSNKAYFDPTLTYKPWWDYTKGDFFENEAPTNARWDPFLDNKAARPDATGWQTAKIQPEDFPKHFNLTQDIALSKSDKDANYAFNASKAAGTLTAGTWYVNITKDKKKQRFWAQVAKDTSINTSEVTTPGTLSVGYYPATFYLPSGTSLPSNYSTFDTTKSTCAASVDASLGMLCKYEIKPGNFGDSSQYSAAIQNFANWFTYYRTRHLATRGSIGLAFADIKQKSMWLGFFNINTQPTNISMVDFSDDASRADLFNNKIYQSSIDIGKTATPNLQAVKYMGEQFVYQYQHPETLPQKGAEKAQACQKNFGILFTDGVANPWTGAGVGNLDGDNLSDTTADIAMYYYSGQGQQNMASRFSSSPGRVSVPYACKYAAPDDLKLDCNTYPHMNFYAVSLGNEGNLFPDYPDPYAASVPWPIDLSTPADKEDDLWHATINGRGQLFSASKPTDIRDRLSDIFNAIANTSGSAASVATTSAYLGTDTLVFLAKFDSGTWTGDVEAYTFSGGKLADTPLWQASRRLPDYAERRNHLYSYDPDAAKGIVFDWAYMNSTQQAYLNQKYQASVVVDANDGQGFNRVQYLQGNTRLEKRSGNGGLFRDRLGPDGNENLLGDFVDSNPAYAGRQDFGYDVLDPAYTQFVAQKKNRSPVLYVGGNDGMLHGFNATKDPSVGGREVLGFVPNAVYPNLGRLTAPDYADGHRFMVDGSPWVGDADLGGWKSILLGTTGAGGRSVFALDVTDPDNFDASKVLWEFTDPDLGYTLPQPTLVRTKSTAHPWVALVANGYGSDNNHAVLWVLDLKDGTVVQKIDTQAGGSTAKNGLSTPIAIDIDDDRQVDFVYAGDLLGNLWKFNLDSADANQWRAAYGTQAKPAPLFVACAKTTANCADDDRQPITAKPQVGLPGSQDGVMVYFGTGKYFEVGDNDMSLPAQKQLQSFYGVWDPNALDGTDPTDRTHLVAQTIEQETTLNSYRVRLTSSNAVDFSQKRGWYMDLSVVGQNFQGERVVSNPTLHDSRITFSSFIPANTGDSSSPDYDPCGHGGNGWIMELTALNGNAPTSSYPNFDTNQDGKLNSDDLSNAIAPTGIGIDAIPNSTRIIRDNEYIYRITSKSDGAIENNKGTLGNEYGRLSWRQIH